MSTPLHAQVSGRFTTPATLVPVDLSIPSGCDTIEIINMSDIVKATNTPAVIVMAEGRASLPSHTALTQSGTGAGLDLNDAIKLDGGFTFIPDSGDQTPLAAITTAAGVTKANPAVVTTTDTHTDFLQTGDIVRMSNTTAMLQIGGMDFSVGTVVTDTSFQLVYLDASGFAAPATANTYRKIPFDARFYPARRFITGITKAAQAVVTLSVKHGFTVGQEVRVVIPAIPGNPVTQTMFEMNNQLATIVAVDLVNNTITLNIDSSAFTAFRFATSAEAAKGWTMPEIVPVGEAATVPYANLLDDATHNVSFTGVEIDPAILVASRNYSWIATKGQSV